MSLRLGRLLQRVDEALLLALAAGVTLAAALPLQLMQPEGIRAAGLMPPLALIGLFVVLHLALLLRGWRADPIVRPVLLVLMGVQFLTTGVLSELITRTYFASSASRPYVIRTIGSDGADGEAGWCVTHG